MYTSGSPLHLNFLATLVIRQRSQRIIFESAAEMLGTFGLQLGRARRNHILWRSQLCGGPPKMLDLIGMGAFPYAT
jgi:hypothetical protein